MGLSDHLLATLRRPHRMFLANNDIHLHGYTVSKPRRSESEISIKLFNGEDENVLRL
jgi:hypothetical protein